jgi:hypothetical protein
MDERSPTTYVTDIGVRFYAGHPLILQQRLLVGTLCISIRSAT